LRHLRGTVLPYMTAPCDPARNRHVVRIASEYGGGHEEVASEFTVRYTVRMPIYSGLGKTLTASPYHIQHRQNRRP
jgi:hypothetical protein